MGAMSRPTSPARAHGLRRPILALLAALLALPLQALVAAPAHAAPNLAEGAVVDALGQELADVAVEALAAPAYTSVASSTTTDVAGTYGLPLPAGTYHLRFSKAGFETTFYGGEVPLEVVVDDEGAITAGGEPVEDNLLDDVVMTGTGRFGVTGVVTDQAATPLPGILVEAFAAGGDEVATDEATTDGSGSYALQVPAGTYLFRYSDPGGSHLGTWYGGDADPTEVVVDQDTSLATVTLAEPEAGQEFPVAGVVVDANHDPVDGVAVTLTPVDPSTDSGSDITRTAGEEAGFYSVSVLPGRYRVGYSKTGFVTTSYGGLATPATVTVSDNGTLSVDPAEELVGNRLADLVLESDPFEVTGAARDQATGTPIEGITVRAFPAGSTDPAEVVATDLATDAAGRYALALPIGGYDLELSDRDDQDPTYTTATLADVRVSQGGALSVAGSPVEALPDVQLAVSSADTPHPVVGSLVDANGTEIDGLTVTAVPLGSGTADSATSGADGALGDHGRYRLMLTPGDYRIEIDGGTRWVDTTYVGEGTSAASVTVQPNGTVLVNGVETVGGELGATEVASLPVTVSGSVERSTGGALAGIAVTAYAADDAGGAVVDSAGPTAADGSYTLDLPVGAHAVRFSDADPSDGTYVTTWLDGDSAVVVNQDGTVTVGEQTGATIPVVAMTLSSADTIYDIAGEVLDNAGDPLDGITVTAIPVAGTPAGNQAGDDTGADPAVGGSSLGDHGVYRIPLQAGTYELRFTGTGYEPAWYLDPDGELGTERARIQVLSGGTVRINSTDVPGGVLEPMTLVGTATHPVTGRVLDDESQPLGGITVQAVPDGGGPVAASAVSGTDGTFTLATPVGHYTIEYVDADPAAPTYVARFLTGPTGTPLVLKVATGGALSIDDQPVDALGDVVMEQASEDTTYDLKGLVYDEVYEPLDGATVVVLPAGTTDEARKTASAVTGADTVTGDASLGQAGVYRIAVRPGKYWLKYRKAGYATTWFSNGEDTGPSTVTVALDGRVTVPGLTLVGNQLDDVQLPLPAVVATRAPGLTGKAVVGKTVTVDVGAWKKPENDAPFVPDRDYLYVEWFLDGKPADDFATGYYSQNFKVTAAAGGKSLSFRLTVDDPAEETTRETAVFTSRAVPVPKAPSTVTGVFRKGRLTITVKVPTLPRPTGTLTVLAGRKPVGKARLVTRSKGVAVLALKLRKGKHRLTIVYSGTDAVAGAKKSVTVRA